MIVLDSMVGKSWYVAAKV